MKKSTLSAVAGASALMLALAACGGGDADPKESESGKDAAAEETSAEEAEGDKGGEASGNKVEVMIGSSSDAEKSAVEAAVAAWSEESGQPAEVIVASDMAQQLSQGFAGGQPADVFYLAPEQIVTYASNGSLLPYGDEAENKDDFFPALTEAFTYEDQLYCLPKDFSTLALVINNAMWEEAGLTEADYPTTWEELADVSAKLTSGDRVGLSFGPEVQRIGVFMLEAGGQFVSDDGKSAIDTPENLEALKYIQDNMKAGSFAYSSDLGAGWGGEAFGKGLSAMVIEGNWITGALQADFPDVEYTVVELPEGPGGKGTLSYTNCWGIAADGDATDGAKDLVSYLTKPETQMEFADKFGVMPSLTTVADQWKEANPALAPFMNGGEYSATLPAHEGASDVIAEMNSQISGLKDGDPQAILTAVDQAMAATLP